MNAAYFRRMIDYTYWAHRQVWGCIGTRATSSSSARSTTRLAQSTSRSFTQWTPNGSGCAACAANNLKPSSASKAYPTREKVRARWDEIEAGWKEFTAALTDEQVMQTIEYTSVNGVVKRSQPMWEGLAQIINHATDHRAQTLALIHQVGGETLAQDFIFYSWENPVGE